MDLKLQLFFMKIDGVACALRTGKCTSRRAKLRLDRKTKMQLPKSTGTNSYNRKYKTYFEDSARAKHLQLHTD